MFRFFLSLIFLSLALPPLLVGQSKKADYEAAVLKSIQEGTFEPHVCGNSHRDFPANISRSCAQTNQAYGTAGWQPSSGTSGFDASCTVASVGVPACSNGKYQVPIAITIFENAAYSGTNYLNGSGFAALPDSDIDNALTTLNNYYANANIEFYEARTRRRITDPDIYDFYASFLGSNEPSTGDNDGNDDDTETQGYDYNNIINIYFVGGLNGDHDATGITGYASLPPSRDYSVMAYRALFGSTLYHELGHYLGLFHTHYNQSIPGDNPGYPPEDALNNSDCNTNGDLICDTWPDPNFSGCNSSSCVYNAACGALTIDPASGTNYGGGVSTILQENIMNYNSFTGCRTDFSPCQYFKVNDILLNCRNNLCDDNVERHFASNTVNDANSPYKQICIGDGIPTFNANGGNCYNWYTVATGGTPVATATATYTPTAVELDVNTPDTTYFYLEEVNSFNTSCRQAAYVIVSPMPGNGREQVTTNTAVTLSTTGASTVQVETTGANLGANEIVGWWLTVDDPISTTVTNQTTLDANLASATVNGAVSTASPNHVFAATSGSPQTAYDLSIDCADLDETKTYYLTPFVSTDKPAVADQNCVIAPSDGGVTVGGSSGRRATINIGDVTCRPASPPNDPTFNFTVTVSGYTGAANNLILSVREDEACGLASVPINQLVAGNGTYSFTESDFTNGLDPDLTGVCVLIYENGGNGASGASMTVSMDITYPGTPAINFPSVTYTNCVFGNPVTIDCDLTTDVATAVGCTSGATAGVTGSTWHDILDGSGNIIASINPNTNDLGTVTVQVNDMAAVGTDGEGKFYIPRYWNFSSSNFSGVGDLFTNGAVSVRIYLLDAELTAYNTANSSSHPITDIALTHYAGPNEDCDIGNNDYGDVSTDVTYIHTTSITSSAYNTGAGNGYQLEFNLDHFSEIGAAGTGILLPLERSLNFDAVVANRSIQLEWLVDANDRELFEIERSVDGMHFESLGKTEAMASKSTYYFVDGAPAIGMNYYRLIWNKSDGSTTKSNVIALNFEEKIPANIIPNPTKGNFTLVYHLAEMQPTSIKIFDVAGKQVYAESWTSVDGMNYHQIDFSAMPTGVYMLQLQHNEGTQLMRFVKMNK